MPDASPLETAAQADAAALPEMAADTSPTAPWPVRHLSTKIGEYIRRMPAVWVEGQVLNVRRWRHLVFLTVRDTQENVSIRATVPSQMVQAMGDALDDGARIVVHARPTWWARNGELTLDGKDLRLVGLGDLLTRIEVLKEALAAEGLFDAARKRPVPMVPRRVGLVCANQGDAEHDVVQGALRRWPAVQFEIRRVSVQGQRCVPETTAAIQDLDADAAVDVIVVARGGGSVEDLLPFSDESLVRTAAACTTPLVSAIGHQQDSPLLDLVADVRASTPTDAATVIVPNADHERAGLERTRAALRRSVTTMVRRERAALEYWRGRPALADPGSHLQTHARAIWDLTDALRRAVEVALGRREGSLRELRAALRSLSPAATLERGYAIVRKEAGSVITSVTEVSVGDHLRAIMTDGEFDLDITAVRMTDQPDTTR